MAVSVVRKGGMNNFLGKFRFKKKGMLYTLECFGRMFTLKISNLKVY